jgi:hypothetical protein
MEPTDSPIVFGAPYSVYARAVRLALEEKGVRYELVPIDIFSSEGAPAEYKARHGSAKSPRSSTPDFAYKKRARSPAMWMTCFLVLGSSQTILVVAPG